MTEQITKPIRILHVLGNTQLGGAESRIMDLYRHIDRSRLQFDFLVHSQEEGHFNKEIQELGGRIYRVPRFRVFNLFSYRREVKKFFAKHHEFRAVQGHITSTAGIYLPIAKRAGILTAIAHARSAGVDPGLKGMMTRFLRLGLARKADYCFTCSELAGISVFGRKAVKQGETTFIPNAIDCERFAYNKEMREKIRVELGLADAYIIGHVGRFHYSKNHEYLIRVFAEFAALNTQSDVEPVLICLGAGDGMTSCKELAKELGVETQVFFLGNKTNIYDYYQAMDYFVYPSRFEGLPGTIVEAQTAGLRCLMSDQICQEVMATELVKAMPITVDPKEWADYIQKTMYYERTDYADSMKEAGFDVTKQAEFMCTFYEGLPKGETEQ